MLITMVLFLWLTDHCWWRTKRASFVALKVTFAQGCTLSIKIARLLTLGRYRMSTTLAGLRILNLQSLAFVVST